MKRTALIGVALATLMLPGCASINAPHREHSRKPDEFYDTVRRVTEGPRVDMFSREPRDGFGQWGIETGKFAGSAA
jgi:N6-adenosine-specific RNA methylase IME4